MRILAIVLGVLILLIQYPLWLGKGGWLKVWDADRQVAAQKQVNDDMQSRNDGLAAEVTDLKQGMEAVEERARYDLGFVKKDEVFFQIIEPSKADTPPGR
ncbi:MAG TPA: cell division protein FtsB [Burkholderiales bacterium]